MKQQGRISFPNASEKDQINWSSYIKAFNLTRFNGKLHYYEDKTMGKMWLGTRIGNYPSEYDRHAIMIGSCQKKDGLVFPYTSHHWAYWLQVFLKHDLAAALGGEVRWFLGPDS
jgi:hypothetical protein